MRLAYNGKKKSERLQTFSSEFMLFNEPVMLEEKAQDQPRDKGYTIKLVFFHCELHIVC